MKRFGRIGIHILLWMTISMIIFYFKWAAQDSFSLPGLPGPETEGFLEIIRNNTDVIFVSLFGSIPVFYWSLYFLSPRLLFKRSYLNIALYAAILTAYYYVLVIITSYVFPMYFYFGIPYAVKVLVPVVFLSGLSGTLIEHKKNCRRIMHSNNMRAY